MKILRKIPLLVALMISNIFILNYNVYAQDSNELMKYDFNNDNIINSKDIDEITNKYNTYKDDGRYDKKYDLNNDGIIDIYDIAMVSKNDGKKVRSCLVVIDAGHNYGGDDGAYGNGYSERDLNMQVTIKLEEELKSRGYNVYLTRTPVDMSGYALTESLRRRYTVANDLKADLFISLHHNSSESASSTGVSTYYSTYKPNIKDNPADLIPLTSHYDGKTDIRPTNAGIQSRELAKNVVNALSSRCGYGKSDSDQGRIGYVDRNLSVTVNTNMPSILVELGYISNANEARRCANQGEQLSKVRVIADEIVKMF
ncbi:N-acetylmuramoyl-L-alanine amidase [Clostridium cavendishii DSM 21758]|uniref:N-acetylmuramoyl-L-alanine amidase n=1 Tax=Clostridium cavendishii DSM 21758 TaxID=1121302 RepID=A0A1M6Q840_9CLOT|nr:N-acetylmuramoyl-L-alanine amidase [Clostridium cavendishii]SHK16295.1 N-acetylmuramoyl-L-alanine amidase [Clostridium cavendishii DSM 21758]